MLAFANRLAANKAQGTADLFGGGATARAQMDVRVVTPWTPMERLQHEFEAVGFFLSGHPLDAYKSVLDKLGVLTYAEIEAKGERGAVAGRVAGIVVSARERRSQKGNKFAFAMYSEPTGQFEAGSFCRHGPPRAACWSRHRGADLGRGRTRRRDAETARAGVSRSTRPPRACSAA